MIMGIGMSTKIRKPDDDLQILEFVDDVSEETAVNAVMRNPVNLKLIKNPSQKVIDLALERMPKAITFIEEPTTDQIIHCCSRAPSLFNRYYGNLDDSDLIELATKCHTPRWFKANQIFSVVAPKQAKKIILDRVENISYVPPNLGAMPLKEQEKFVKDYPSLVLQMKNPRKEIWNIAINADPDIIGYVDCPPHAIYIACTVKPELVMSHLDVIVNNIDKFLIHLANTNNKIMLQKLVSHDIINKANQNLVRGLMDIMGIKMTDISDK